MSSCAAAQPGPHGDASLWNGRHEGDGPPEIVDGADDDDDEKVYSPIMFNPRPGGKGSVEKRPEDERYLAYLPHSGYHNQRISLTNALLLSHLLNRTLLLPPLILGEPVPFHPTERLAPSLRRLVSHRTALKGTCSRLSIDPRCKDWRARSLVSWEAVVDLAAVRARGIKYVEWWSLDEAFFSTHLGLTAAVEGENGWSGEAVETGGEVRRFKCQDRHAYQIHANAETARLPPPASTDPGSRPIAWKTHLEIEGDLARAPEKILLFGTIFGSTRLDLRGMGPGVERLKEGLRQDLALNLPELSRAAESTRKVMDRAGAGFIGYHLRINERIFAWESGRNVRQNFHTLLTTHLSVPRATATALELATWSDPASRGFRELVLGPAEPGKGHWDGLGPLRDLTPDSVPFPLSPSDIPPFPPPPAPEPFHWTPSTIANGSSSAAPPPATGPLTPRPAAHSNTGGGGGARHLLPKCPRPLHKAKHLLALNTPLFIATDRQRPLAHPALTPLIAHLPCVFFLSDLVALPSVAPALRPLRRLTNEEDGVPLWPFLLPFLDGLTAAGGRRVLGTRRSTMSTYVMEIEWPKTWGL